MHLNLIHEQLVLTHILIQHEVLYNSLELHHNYQIEFSRKLDNGMKIPTGMTPLPDNERIIHRR